MDIETATTLVEEHIETLRAPDGPTLIAFLENTETHDFGWVFYYGSKDPSNPVDGNAPLIVDRMTGHLYETGTASPLVEYIKNFRETGDPHRHLGRSVTLNRLLNDEHRIAIVLAIRDSASLSLSTAKKTFEDCLDGLSPTIALQSEDDAKFLATRLTELGMNVTHNPELR